MSESKTHDFELVGGDTDGLAFRKKNHSPFSKEERVDLLKELNSQMDSLIRWEDDGCFPIQLVVKTKNYALVDENGNKKIKGSALKATTKEKAFQKFIQEAIDLLINDKQTELLSLYFSYAKKILAVTDVSEWCAKKTITEAVLKNTRTNEARVREALKGRYFQEGDKIYVFNKTPTELCLMEDFDGTYSKETLFKKLYDTLCVFETVIDVTPFPNLNLKRNKHILDGLAAPIPSN